MLLEIDEYYKLYVDFERRNGPLGQHKARLADIAKLSRKLRPLIEAEPLMWHFENEWPSLNSDSLIHFLQMLEQTARELSRNKQYLDRVRFKKRTKKRGTVIHLGAGSGTVDKARKSAGLQRERTDHESAPYFA